MTLFKAKYRVESTRLKGWDYASAGWYFVTICTRRHDEVFGQVIGGEIRLSSAGEVVAEEWLRTAKVRDNVDLDEWIVMPNHIHGILAIRIAPPAVVEMPRKEIARRETAHRAVSTVAGLQAGSLGAVVGQFKSVCTKRICAAGRRSFTWQERFFDHIIRDDRSLQHIRQYIVNNPMKWEEDRDNPANLWM